MRSNPRVASLLFISPSSVPQFSYLQTGSNNSDGPLGRLGGLKVPGVVPNTLVDSVNGKYHHFDIDLRSFLIRGRGQQVLEILPHASESLRGLVNMQVAGSCPGQCGVWSVEHTLRITVPYPIHETCVQMRPLFNKHLISLCHVPDFVYTHNA